MTLCGNEMGLYRHGCAATLLTAPFLGTVTAEDVDFAFVDDGYSSLLE